MAQRERIKIQFEQYTEALNTLKEAVLIKVPSVLERDGTIKRFEYTYEICWKLLKTIVFFKVGIKCIGPRDSFKAGFRANFIENEFEAVFVEMINKRNLTVHTYNENRAIEIYEFIKDEGFRAFECLREKIDEYLYEEKI